MRRPPKDDHGVQLPEQETTLRVPSGVDCIDTPRNGPRFLKRADTGEERAVLCLSQMWGCGLAALAC